MITTDELVKEMDSRAKMLYSPGHKLWYFVRNDDYGKNYTSQMFTAEALAMYAWRKNLIDWQ